MIVINIANDFSKTPGWRYYSDGPKSGEEFYEELLRHKFHEALLAKVKLKIILDGVNGFTTSFLNESFRRLAKEYGEDVAWNNLIILSNEIPKYIVKIKEAIYGKK